MSLSRIQEAPQSGLTLLTGPPGAGKSTLCLHIIQNGIVAERPIIFVTTEQSPSGITALLRRMGGGITVLHYIDAFTETVGLTALQEDNTVSANCEDLNSISMAIAQLQQRINQSDILLVFDSLTTPYLLNKDELFRFMRLGLMRFAGEGNSVVALMDEGCCKSEELLSMMSIADGVIKLEMGEHKQLVNVIKHPKLAPTRIEVAIEPGQMEAEPTTYFDPDVMKQFVKSTIGHSETQIEVLRGTLVDVPLFSSITSADDLSNLSRRLTRRRYRKGDIIFHKDDFGSTFHIITAGKVKLSIPEEDRDDMFLAQLEPGDFFGEMSLLDESPRSATAIAIEPTETLALERKDFLDFLKHHPDMAISMLNVLAQRLRDLNSRLQDIILFKPQTRLARALIKLVQSHGKETSEGWEIPIPLTLTGLTGTIGTSTATLRRLLREFQTAGIISISDQRYIIHNLRELQKKAV